MAAFSIRDSPAQCPSLAQKKQVHVGMPLFDCCVTANVLVVSTSLSCMALPRGHDYCPIGCPRLWALSFIRIILMIAALSSITHTENPEGSNQIHVYVPMAVPWAPTLGYGELWGRQG